MALRDRALVVRHTAEREEWRVHVGLGSVRVILGSAQQAGLAPAMASSRSGDWGLRGVYASVIWGLRPPPPRPKSRGAMRLPATSRVLRRQLISPRNDGVGSSSLPVGSLERPVYAGLSRFAVRPRAWRIRSISNDPQTAIPSRAPQGCRARPTRRTGFRSRRLADPSRTRCIRGLRSHSGS